MRALDAGLVRDLLGSEWNPLRYCVAGHPFDVGVALSRSRSMKPTWSSVPPMRERFKREYQPDLVPTVNQKRGSNSPKLLCCTSLSEPPSVNHVLRKRPQPEKDIR